MIRPTCSQLRRQLQEIKSIKGDFDLELANTKDTRDIAPVYALEKEIKEKIRSMDGSVFCFIDTAENILGKDMLGPDTIELTFGFRPEDKDIPLIMFSKNELERAKELGQMLILQIDKTPAGQLLTMKAMNELKGGKTKDGEDILWDNNEAGEFESNAWYKDEIFFTTETPALGWALISKELIPKSTKKNYLKQTEEMVNYLEKQVFKDRSVTLKYKEAISEFKRIKYSVKRLLSLGRNIDAEMLEQLEITQLTRQTPVEVLYSALLMKEKNNEYILSNHKYNWTNRRNYEGKMVCLGNINHGGMDISSWKTDSPDSGLGVSFFCRRSLSV